MCLFLMTVSQQAERWMELLFSETTNPSPIPMDSIIGDDSVVGTVQHVVQLTPHPNRKKLHNSKKLHIPIQRKHRKELSKSKHKGQIKETHTSVHIHVKPLRLTEPSNADCCSEAHLAVLSRHGASSTQRSLLVRTVFTALLLP